MRGLSGLGSAGKRIRWLGKHRTKNAKFTYLYAQSCREEQADLPVNFEWTKESFCNHKLKTTCPMATNRKKSIIFKKVVIKQNTKNATIIQIKKYGAKYYNLQVERRMEYYANKRGTKLPSYCRNSNMQNLDILHISDTKPNHINFIIKL